MPRGKIPEKDLTQLAALYNSDGEGAVKEVLISRYGINQPYSAIRRMRLRPELGYDADSNRFMINEADDTDGVFMSMDELCSAPGGSGESFPRDKDDSQSADMERLVHELIGERLLELSKYVTLSSLSRTVIVDRTALEGSGYRLEIH